MTIQSPALSYRAPHRVLTMTCVGLGAFALLDLAHLASGLMALRGIGALGPQAPDAAMHHLSILIKGFSALVQLILYPMVIVGFLILMHRFAKNARALGISGFRFSPGWCVGWFFVPIANMIMPYKAIGEVWRSSKLRMDESRSMDWSFIQPGQLFNCWWLTWILGTIATSIAAQWSLPGPDQRDGLLLVPVAAALQVTSAILAILVLRRLISSQDAQARNLHARLSSFTENSARAA